MRKIYQKMIRLKQKCKCIRILEIKLHPERAERKMKKKINRHEYFRQTK
jgi:hypothetical protein